jgi:hypothetical protein
MQAETYRSVAVKGRCPACRMETLFLGAGGYVTCSFDVCPTPGAASDLLEQGYLENWEPVTRVLHGV